ncbi:single-stranded-DNA-specific exonuclease RecJ [Desulforamulus hydrothermalis]|uniref:Single-stranded-DNA-specific exonuclease RecJ n=1 Tax=Desulforamulus hydrothermalis Lam5 = DSM 18033 TaxID=1121428 RepID=K8E013_9FIRM|nr:single-stranded-DNA-specific exonuclease RecJ [Desulforamulus hydrothermalis]CCO08782.1 Single-stranded-DNA-specific exonuclease RecJ [Desulforamulus hydrothermalis Lam5 = DSM 18033]SHG71375.1 exonuclease RecJ [Desulforamulus hydrothermalis Lam5 = DSM 18033]
MRRQKKWRVKAPYVALRQILAKELGISEILAQLLVNRGIYTADQGRTFLGSELDRLFSPWLLKDMEKAVERINLARQNGESILVFGDYDVDGITGTVVLVLALRKLGCRVDYFIPHRLEEGYGLNTEALTRAVEQGFKLLVTVDCGISGAAEVAAAKQSGLDVIITDHHEPPARLPAATAVIDPKRPDCTYPFKELAGVGVALKLVQGLYERVGLAAGEWEEYLDLVCLGTVADIVPLQGENRILVKHGLDKIAHSQRPGLQALIKVSGVKSESMGTRELGFALAPRLNAAGRMGDAALGVELLLADDPLQAAHMAEALNRGNQERQQVEAKVLAEALAMVEAEPAMADEKVLVLASANWHPGVIGIVASRLVDRFYRPVFMISLEDGKGKGSARSIPGFHLYQAMVSCQEHLEQFGGHAMAAGFSIPADKIMDFRRAVNKLADEILTDEHLTPNLDLDALVDLNELSLATVRELAQLLPFGHCNPGPVLGCRQAKVLHCREVGKNGSHLKLKVKSDQVVLDGIGFNLASYSEMLATGDSVDMAFVPSINCWNGRLSVQLEVKEFKETGEVCVAAPGERTELLRQALHLPEEKIYESMLPLGILQWCWNHTGRGPGLGNTCCDFELTDYRDCPDRLARLLQVINQGSCSLVLVESAAQAIQVAVFLSNGESAWRQQVLAYHPLMGETAVQQMINQLRANGAKVLVATALAPVGGICFDQVIFFHLPYHPEECQINHWQAKRVFLLGGQSHAPEGREYIRAMAPERETLAALYRLLRLKINSQGQGQVSKRELQQCLQEFYPRAAGLATEIGLTVFRELGLLEYSRQADQYIFKINRQVRSDLQNSPTYHRALHIKEACQRFQQRFLAAAGDKLQQMFCSNFKEE